MAQSTVESRALERFEATVIRGESLLDLYDRLSKVKMSKAPQRFEHDDIADLLRSGLVLPVAAMDAYFTARFVELLVPFLKQKDPTDKLVALLSKAGLDTREALTMIDMDRPYRRVRTLMDVYFERYVTQRAQVIDELFLAYGIVGFTTNAQKLAKRKNLVRRIDLMVQRRHQIVHEGDLNSHGTLRVIDDQQVRGYVKDLRVFVNAAHELTEQRMK